jgi:hypothetical protein
MNILKLNRLRISYKEDAMSAILETELWNTLLSVIYVEEIRFKETNNMIK